MGWQGWYTLGVVGLVLGLLIWNRIGTDIVIVAGVALLVFGGVLTPKEAVAGMSNEGMITVAILYVVVCGLTETGAVSWLGRKLLGRPRGALGAQLRLLLPVTTLSAFMNNTPLVAMFIPVVTDWCKKYQLSPSKLMIPLSYAAILGGTCTLIGTSTNLVVAGKWKASGRPELGIFEITAIGVPCAIVAIIYLMTLGRRLLPERKPVLSVKTDARSYTVEMMVEEGGPLVGKTIEQAGLRQLPGLYLAEIERGGEVIAAVGPEERLKGGDLLFFVGVVDSVLDLQKIRGLVPAPDQVKKLAAPRPNRSLIEAVVSHDSPLVGRSIREGRFRTVYNAVVIAVARSGERINQKIGDIVLRPGDTLLLEAPKAFLEQHRHSRDFFLVSQVENSTPIRHERATLALVILAGMVAIATFEPVVLGQKLQMLHAAVIAAGLMIVTRCCTGPAARRSIDWTVLVIIAASLGLGTAMEKSGAAATIAHTLVSMAQGNPWLTLAMIYLTTMCFTELITNNAAAMLVFPIADAAAANLGVDFKPFAFAIMMAASSSFSTPIGYQTNLMVMAPGGYRFTDYFRVGIPMNILMMISACLIIPMVYPLAPVEAATPQPPAQAAQP